MTQHMGLTYVLTHGNDAVGNVQIGIWVVAHGNREGHDKLLGAGGARQIAKIADSADLPVNFRGPRHFRKEFGQSLLIRFHSLQHLGRQRASPLEKSGGIALHAFLEYNLRQPLEEARLQVLDEVIEVVLQRRYQGANRLSCKKEGTTSSFPNPKRKREKEIKAHFIF